MLEQQLGFWGLGHWGRALLEQCLLRTGFHSAAATDSTAEGSGWGRSRVRYWCESEMELLTIRPLTAVCVDLHPSHQSAAVSAVLRMGLKAIVPTPLIPSLETLQQWMGEAELSGAQIIPYTPGGFTPRQNTLIEAWPQASIGRITSLEYQRQRLAVTLAHQSEFSPQQLLLGELRDVIREACLLVQSEVVAAQGWMDGSVDPVQPATQATTGITLVARLEFPSQVACWIRLSRTSLVPRTAGWTVEGTLGAVSESEAFRLAADGELINHPRVRNSDSLSAASPIPALLDPLQLLVDSARISTLMQLERHLLLVQQVVAQSLRTGVRVELNQLEQNPRAIPDC